LGAVKTAIRIASYLLALAVGLGAGYYFGYEVSQRRALALDVVETAYYSAYTKMQMAEGTGATREETIRGFLALSVKRKGHWTPLFTEKGYAIDSALANARLCVLAQKRGATQEAQEYLTRAALFCPQIGWQECSAEKIVSFAERLDRHSLFGGADPQ
jgi:hypothetical protein